MRRFVAYGASDPVIRDFVGLNENFWDAAGPDGIPGSATSIPISMSGAWSPNFSVKLRARTLNLGPEADRVADSSALANPKLARCREPATGDVGGG